MAESSHLTTLGETPREFDDPPVNMDPLADKFRGCLVGALMGDCLGHPFEFNPHVPEDTRNQLVKCKLVDYSVLNEYFYHLNQSETIESLKRYTDDTVMTRCIAHSLVAKKGFDAKDMAERLVNEFYSDRMRAYGPHVGDVFEALKETKVKDPYGPASTQFGGAGSYGNGSAMGVSPVALFAYKNEGKLIEIAHKSALITHTHRNGYNGAILQCLAVHQALKFNPHEPLNATEFLSYLKKKIDQLESESEKNFPQDETLGPSPYAKKLDKVKELLEMSSSERDDGRHVDELAVDSLGNNITALGSVPTAIFAVLHAQKSLSNIETDNKFQRCIQYAISLGGDTDTIGSMAGAIAGAHLGFEATTNSLRRHCENLGLSVWLADELFHVVMGKGRSCELM